MNRIRLITHGGHSILLVDVSGCESPEMIRVIDEVPKHVREHPKGSLLLLADFTGAQFSREVVERLKIATVFDRPHLKRSAWVLTANLPKALYESIKTFSGRNLPIFATREEALDFLVAADHSMTA
ncbi:MAG TPA: hypothetical protein VKW78_00955 [Terriglobales bacterium]|nr:hypothetical protein [Terriglobales bacterium]